MDGGTEGHADDPSIPGDWRFLRRIHPHWIKSFRPESSNFESREAGEGLSVTAWLTDADLEAVVSEEPSFGVVLVTAAQLRDAGYRIVRVPLDENPSHCECFGRITKGGKKQLARLALWVRIPAGHGPADYGDLAAL